MNIESKKEFPSLENHFLVSMPKMQDPNFSSSVSLVCQHNKNGALGVIINHPVDNLGLKDILNQLELDYSDKNIGTTNRVFKGGPVHPQHGLVLHENQLDWESSLRISEDLVLTSSLDVLRSIAAGDGPAKFLMILGYAGWGPGQLELEIQQNSWLTMAANPEIIFSTPAEKKWQKTIINMGIDITQLSSDVGRA